MPNQSRRAAIVLARPHSAFIILHSAFPVHAAIDIAPPPCRLVVTLSAAGPFCLRSLNQNAVNHTFDPGATVFGKLTEVFTREVSPSKVQPASSVGATAPQKLYKAAPLTPAGLPRRDESPAACRRRVTVLPRTDSMSITGALSG